MYVSRKYLKEKYNALKHDMENVLQVLDESQDDSIDEADIKRVAANIKDKCDSISREFKCGEVSISTTNPPMIFDSISLSDDEQGLMKCDCCGSFFQRSTACTAIIWTDTNGKKASNKLYCGPCYEKYLDKLQNTTCDICNRTLIPGVPFLKDPKTGTIRCKDCHIACLNKPTVNDAKTNEKNKETDLKNLTEDAFKCGVCGNIEVIRKEYRQQILNIDVCNSCYDKAKQQKTATCASCGTSSEPLHMYFPFEKDPNTKEFTGVVLYCSPCFAKKIAIHGEVRKCVYCGETCTADSLALSSDVDSGKSGKLHYMCRSCFNKKNELLPKLPENE